MAKANLLFVGTDDGLVLFSQPGATGRWLRVGHVLRATRVDAVWADADDPTQLGVSTADGQTLRSQDSGDSWADSQEALPRADALPPGVLARLPGNTPIYLGLRDGTIARGETPDAAEPTESDTPWQGALTLVQPANYHIDTAFAGTDAGQIMVSTDRGRRWQQIRADLPPIRSIAAARLA